MSCILLGRLSYLKRLYYIRNVRFLLSGTSRFSTLLDNYLNAVSNKNDTSKLPNGVNKNNAKSNGIENAVNSVIEAEQSLQDEVFETYWNSIDMESFKENNPKLVVKGTVSIPAFNTSDSYIKSDGDSSKIFGFIARNRAFHGDLVQGVRIRRTKSNSSNNIYNTENVDNSEGCRIVRILKRNPQIYKLVGTLKYSESNNNIIRVQPRDHRFPAFIIPQDSIDTSILNVIRDGAITKKSFICTFTFHSWDVNALEPTAKLLNIIGESGDSKAEADALVNYYGFNHLEFNEDILKECERMNGLPDVDRIDLTDLNVFSIDPITAKDLDDAISIESISKYSYRIGVHIADVCHYVKPHTHIDMEAKIRCTTVYLDHFVYPMLPRKLSEDLCSLLPNSPKKCFSVLFDFNIDTSSVDNVKFVKSIIKSRYKLSYDVAENIINDKEIKSLNLPNDLIDRVKTLFQISQLLKHKRIGDNRGMRISSDYSEQLHIPLVDSHLVKPPNDKATNEKNPISDENSDILSQDYPKLEIHPLQPKSHSLIEELMVLTNQLVADHLLKHYNLSLFRIHQDTSNEVRAHLIRHIPQKVLDKLDIDVNSVPIQTLLNKCKQHIDSYEFDCLNFIALQKFKEAVYIASSKSDNVDVEDQNNANTTNATNSKNANTKITNKQQMDLSHWGLGIEAYLHFTSPIRRYADIITHRLLEDLLSKRDLYSYDCELISKVADNCNAKKRLAFDAQIEYKSLILNKYLTWANNYCKSNVIKGFVKTHNSDIYGYHTQGVVKEIIIPQIVYNELEKACNIKFKIKPADKTALGLYVPFLRQTRSLSLETLNLDAQEIIFEFKNVIYKFTFASNEIEAIKKGKDENATNEIVPKEIATNEAFNEIKITRQRPDKMQDYLTPISLKCAGKNGTNWTFRPMSSSEIILIPGSQMWSLRIY